MKHKSLSLEKLQELLSYYQAQPLEKLKKIEPKWAYGRHIKKLLNPDLHPKNKKNYAFFLANLRQLISNAHFGNFELYPLFTGVWNNDSRITRLLYGWENNCFVDPPHIWLQGLNRKTLSFGDGRHRTKLSFHLGFEQLPIAIDRDEFDEINSIVQLTRV